jgi:hypothetical protein
VEILEQVQQILGSVTKALNLRQDQASTKKAVNPASLSMDERSMNNIFAVLKLEDPADVDQSLVEPTNKSQPTTYELEDDVDAEEVYFKIHCFFTDFADMRKHISQSWSDYISGILDLATVAVTTNVALEMLQRAETELIKIMPKKFDLTTYETIAGLLQTAFAYERGVGESARQSPGDIINLELKDIADLTSLPVYVILV